MKQPVTLVGTSLGGAVALDFALAHPEAVERLVLLSPQCFTDGIGPMASLPDFAARLGVRVRSPLRMMQLLVIENNYRRAGSLKHSHNLEMLDHLRYDWLATSDCHAPP